MPLPNAAGNRYIASPTRTGRPRPVRRRASTTSMNEQAARCSAATMRRGTDRRDAAAITTADQLGDGDAAGLHGLAHVHVHLHTRSTWRASRSTGSTRTRRSRAGSRTQRLRHQSAEHQPARAAACRRSRSRASSPAPLGDAQQPFVKRVNQVCQFTDDFTLDQAAATR